MAVIKTRSTVEVVVDSSVAKQLSLAVAADQKRKEAEMSMFSYAREAAKQAASQYDAKLGLVDGVDKLVTAYSAPMEDNRNVQSIFRDALLLFCAGNKVVTVTKQAKGSEPEPVAAVKAATTFAKNDVRSAATALRRDIGIAGNRAGRKADKPVVGKVDKLSDDALLLILGDRMGNVKTAAKVCDLLRSLGYEVAKVKERPSARAIMVATKPLRGKKAA